MLALSSKPKIGSSNDFNGNENVTWWLFYDYCFFLASFIVDRTSYKCTVVEMRGWSKYREWKFYTCVLTLSLKP